MKGQPPNKGLRRNSQIRISPIRLIDEDNNQAGIVDTLTAKGMALKAGLDLVEVAPQAQPPVCRIMDYGKWMYEQKKKEHKAKSHRHESVLKEVRMRPKTDPHDLLIKINRAKGFLDKGHKVQFTMLFRGREMVHQGLGRVAFERIKVELADIAKLERDFRMEGRRLTMIVSPIAIRPTKGAEAEEGEPRPARAKKEAKAKPAAKVEEAKAKPAEAEEAKAKPAEVEEAKAAPAEVEEAKAKPAEVEEAKAKPAEAKAPEAPSAPETEAQPASEPAPQADAGSAPPG